MAGVESTLAALVAELDDWADRLSAAERDGSTGIDPALITALAAVEDALADLPPQRGLDLARARLHTLRGTAAALAGETGAAVTDFDRAVALAEAALDRSGLDEATAAPLLDLAVAAAVDAAVVEIRAAAWSRARDRLDRAERLAERGVRPEVLLAWANARTAVELGRDRIGAAFDWAQAAAGLASDLDGAGVSWALANLAQVCARIGDVDRAVALFEHVLVHPASAAAEIGAARLGLALIALDRDLATGAPALVEVVEHARRTGDRALFSRAALAVGWSGQAGGQVELARRWYAEAAAVLPDPATRAISAALTATTWVDLDPVIAARCREQARAAAGESSWETRVLIDHVTSVEELHSGASSDLDEVVATALVMDAWRIDLPWGVPRQAWGLSASAGAAATALDLAHRAGRTDLVAGITAHLAATLPAPDPNATTPPLPPRVRLAGSDPLARPASLAARRHHRPIRDETRTVDALPTRPGVLDLVAVTRGDTFLCWSAPGGPRVHRVPDGPLATELGQWAAAVRAPAALLDRAHEAGLMSRLGAALLPDALLDDLSQVRLLRVRADGELAALPWALLGVPGGGDHRLIDRVDLVTLAPFGLPRNPDPARRAGVVAVLDPRVPGAALDSPLGPVLGAGSGAAELVDRLSADSVGPVGAGGPALRRTDQDRDWVAAALARGPARLLFLGHAGRVRTADGSGTDTALHLCCTADQPGNAAPMGRHRPLTATDIRAAGWSFPPRVALIACASADDARLRDDHGLAHTMLAAGAELVTGMRWPVPTGEWYRRAGAGGRLRGDPLAETALAVDRAHRTDDPVAAVGEWQRERLAAWRASGELEASPIGWGAVHTVVAD